MVVNTLLKVLEQLLHKIKANRRREIPLFHLIFHGAPMSVLISPFLRTHIPTMHIYNISVPTRTGLTASLSTLIIHACILRLSLSLPHAHTCILSLLENLIYSHSFNVCLYVDRYVY